MAFDGSSVDQCDAEVDFIASVADRLMPAYRAIPGVTGVTPTLIPPFYGTGVWVGRVDLEGQTPEEMKSNPMIPVEVGGAEYFRVHRIPITRGRGVTDGDDDKAEQVAVVSEAAAIWESTEIACDDAEPVGARGHRHRNVEAEHFRRRDRSGSRDGGRSRSNSQ